MVDGSNTKRRNGPNRWKCRWYATYRSARFRRRFGQRHRTKRAVIESALKRFTSEVAKSSNRSGAQTSLRKRA